MTGPDVVYCVDILIQPGITPSGYGIKHLDSHTLAVTSPCCGAYLTENTTSGVFHCMTCQTTTGESNGNTTENDTYNLSDNTDRRGMPLRKWIEMWTGLSGIEVAVTW